MQGFCVETIRASVETCPTLVTETPQLRQEPEAINYGHEII